jgi:hypothetical protein
VLGTEWLIGSLISYSVVHVRCVPYRYRMARPRVEDGGDSLQI